MAAKAPWGNPLGLLFFFCWRFFTIVRTANIDLPFLLKKFTFVYRNIKRDGLGHEPELFRGDCLRLILHYGSLYAPGIQAAY